MWSNWLADKTKSKRVETNAYLCSQAINSFCLVPTWINKVYCPHFPMNSTIFILFISTYNKYLYYYCRSNCKLLLQRMRWETLLLIFKTMHSRLTPHKAERILFFDKEKKTMTTIITISINLFVFTFVSETGDLLAHMLLTSNRISQSCQCLEFRILYADKIINSKKKMCNVVFFKVQSDKISTRASILFIYVKLNRIGYRTGRSSHNLWWLYGSFWLRLGVVLAH